MDGGGVIPTTKTPAFGTDVPDSEDDDGGMDTSRPASTPFQPEPAEPAEPSPPQTSRREHGASHVVAVLLGCLLVLPGLGMLVGGVVAASAQAFATDDGYFRFTPDRIDSDGVAIAATDMWLDGHGRDDGPDWLLDHLDVDLRLRVTGAASTDDVFVGIARTPDVDEYLAGAAYADVVDLDGHTARLRHVAGDASITPPGREDFWTVAVSGPGEQELTWEARGGRWAVVIMNADGSPAVAADIEIGVRSDAVMPIAIVMIVAGGLVLVGGIVLIVIGARGRRVPPSHDAVSDRGAPTDPFPPPTGAAATRTEDELPTPV